MKIKTGSQHHVLLKINDNHGYINIAMVTEIDVTIK